MHLLLIIPAAAIFLIGYYLGKESSKATEKEPLTPEPPRFSKLENKEPAFIRKAKEG